VTAELRIEQKIPLTVGELVEFREWHASVGQVFRACHDMRIVNSIYLDSPDLDDYSDNLDGVSVRRKLRLRWYGDTTLPEQLRVEVKAKRGGLSTKHLFVTPRPVEFANHLRAAVRATRRVVPSTFRLDFDQASQPTLWNRYEREYYATRDGLRLTVDTNLLAAGLPRDRLDPSRLRTSGAHAVVELKFPVGSRDALQQLVGSLPLRIAKHSKYVSGVGGGPW
tara:strand:- start:892 stop:1560 length:669 start_codon:yes stop_codon:yes gene_type:complete